MIGNPSEVTVAPRSSGPKTSSISVIRLWDIGMEVPRGGARIMQTIAQLVLRVHQIIADIVGSQHPLAGTSTRHPLAGTSTWHSSCMGDQPSSTFLDGPDQRQAANLKKLNVMQEFVRFLIG
jgi:hypothetical protein